MLHCIFYFTSKCMPTVIIWFTTTPTANPEKLLLKNKVDALQLNPLLTMNLSSSILLMVHAHAGYLRTNLIWLDDNLNFKHHIISEVSPVIGFLHRNKNCFPTLHRKRLVKSIFLFLLCICFGRWRCYIWKSCCLYTKTNAVSHSALRFINGTIASSIKRLAGYLWLSDRTSVGFYLPINL